MITHLEQRRRSRFREGLALLLLVIAALLFQRSATTPWAESSAADGTRYVISPIGLVKFSSGSASERIAECRWWPKLGDLELCAVAPGGSQAFVWLRRAYPFTVFALWLSVVALFVNALRLPRNSPTTRLVVTASVPALSVVALWCLTSTANRALTVLQVLEIRPLMPGFALVVTATALPIAAIVLIISSRQPTAPGLVHDVS